ncbi:MAG: hypothetical protein HY903_01495 [Deltaproteobacteria bacterium]|nr:hypothetical protein [Deltaproteobacteria bacterium]
MKFHSMSVCVVMLLGAADGARAAGPTVTAKEFQLFMDWKDGSEDPRLAKDNEATRVKKIAKSLGVSAADLKKAIDKVEPAFSSLKAETEAAIRAELDKTPIKKQLKSVEVNIDTAHAVALVKWGCGDARDTDKEASWVAAAVAAGGSIVKTAALWCVNDGDTKLFSAKIGRDAFERIDLKSVDRFATSRYIKLFEDVKRGPHT